MGSFFCGDDNRDTDVSDKLSGVHVEQKWKGRKIQSGNGKADSGM